MLRLAINGYGRIGRSVLRALYESPLRAELQVVAVNELADARTGIDRAKKLAAELVSAANNEAGTIVEESEEVAEQIIATANVESTKKREAAARGLEVILHKTGVHTTALHVLEKDIAERKEILEKQAVQILENGKRIKAFNDAAKGF